MKHITIPRTVVYLRKTDDDPQKLHTIWFVDGSNISARITKVDGQGIYIASPERSGFIGASELCTADRVRYGFGTRKEEEWAAKLNAHEKSAKPSQV